MSKFLLHIFIAGFVFLGILAVAQIMPASAAPPLNFYEECEQEGCSNHEIEELFDSFHHECVVEGCSQEEVRELAGATSRIDNMYTAFCNLGKNFTWFHTNVSTTNCTGLATQNLQVRRFNTVTLSNAQVDTIFQDNNNRLQTDDGGNDVACNVALVRNGNVTAFNANGIPGAFTGTVFTSAQFNAINALAGNVKVVTGLNICGGTIGSFNGCAPVPGTSFVVIRTAPNVSWVHEFGHNQGLGHRNDDATAIMIGNGSANRRRVTPAECTAFRD